MPYVPASLNFRGAVFAGALGARSTANLTRQREGSDDEPEPVCMPIRG